MQAPPSKNSRNFEHESDIRDRTLSTGALLDAGCAILGCGLPLSVERETVVTATAPAPCVCDAVELRAMHHPDCPAGSWTEDVVQRRVRCPAGHFYDELLPPA